MIHAQNDRVVSEVPAAAIGSSATATLVVDTMGYDHASLTVLRSSNAGTVFANVLAVAESDDNVSYTNVTGLVAGAVGGFTVPAVSNTSATAAVKLDIDTKARRRYLRVSYTPGASANVAITGRLSRAEVSPETPAQAGCIAVVRG